MQGDMEIMFAFLFRTVAGCHSTHPDGSPTRQPILCLTSVEGTEVAC